MNLISTNNNSLISSVQKYFTGCWPNLQLEEEFFAFFE